MGSKKGWMIIFTLWNVFVGLWASYANSEVLSKGMSSAGE